MNAKMLLLGMTAATVALTACAVAPVQTPASLPDAVQSLGQDTQVFDFNAPDGGRIVMDLANTAPSKGRQVQAFKEDVAKYEVRIHRLDNGPHPISNTFTVFVNPANSSSARVCFDRLQPGSYELLILARDTGGQVVNASGGADTFGPYHVTSATMLLRSVTLQLEDTFVTLPGGGITEAIKANSGNLVANDDALTSTPTSVANISEPAGAFAPLSNLVGFAGALDDETSLDMHNSGLNASNNRTYTAFRTNLSAGAGSEEWLGPNNDIQWVTNDPLNPLGETLIVRFGNQGAVMNLYFEKIGGGADPIRRLKAISDFYPLSSSPSVFRFVDPETQGAETFFGTAFPAPTGIATTRYQFLADDAPPNHVPTVTLYLDNSNGSGIVGITMRDPFNSGKLL
ncbi:MAG TPA: hypothetical protein V6D00_10505, partial [Pantanalinema sp.]